MRSALAVGGLLVLIAMLPAGAAAAAVPECIAQDRWLAVESRRFTLVTNVTERRAQDIATQLEREADAVFRNSHALRDSSGSRIFVIAIADSACFEAFRLRHQSRAVALGGFFHPSLLGGYLIFNAGLPWYEFETVCHEYVHALVNRQIGNLPLCLNEGLAEYFSTFRANGSGIEYGHAIDEHCERLQHDRLMPMDELFSINGSSPSYWEGERRPMFYAESWALVHYLNSTQDLRERFDRFLTRLKRGEAPRGAFGASFPSESWYGIQDKLKRHAAVRQPPRRELPPGNGRLIESRVSAMRRADVYARLGAVLLEVHDDDRGKGEACLEAALGVDSRCALALAYLGWNADAGGRTEEAESYYDRATHADPGNAEVWLVSGMGPLVRVNGVHDAAWASRQVMAGRERLRHALALDPDNAEALAQFGWAFLIDNRAREAVSPLRRASQALPTRADILTNLIVALAGSGGTAEAKDLLEARLRSLGDADHVKRAENALASAR
jgi:Tfp pilus assembly protein PilF